MSSTYVKAYNRIILGHPILTLIISSLIIVLLGFYSTQFRLDASADTLVLENDTSLKYYRAIKAVYGSDDYLVITYTPESDLFSDEVLQDLQQLRDDLAAIPRVESVTSLLDVPLIKSPPIGLDDLAEGVITLTSPKVDREMARKEFQESPLYQNLIISPDSSTTAIQVLFKRDKTYTRLQNERNALRAKELKQKLSPDETQQLAKVSAEYDAYSASLQDQQTEDIATVRAIMAQHKDHAQLYLGGVPMIASDSIDFVRHDLTTFGVGVFAFLVIILLIIFGRPRWVLLSMLTCIAAGVAMVGTLGLLDWPATVVSSNFISLLLILTLSLMVHLIVKYRELLKQNPDREQRDLLLETVQSKFIPCLYTSLTTMVAFASLIISGIRPVIDFGWMMVIGIIIAQVITFTFFPAALMMLKTEQPSGNDSDLTRYITQFFADINERFNNSILVIFLILAIVSGIGISMLTVENRFIDYYKDTTEIYQGMELIDRKLGGTTPLDVVIDAPQSFFDEMNADSNRNSDATNEDDELLEDLFGGSEGDDAGGITGTSYWFNTYMLDKVAEIHDYLDSLPQTGKVISITTTMRVVESLDPAIANDDLQLSVLYKRLPEDIKDVLITPYMSEDGNQLRFSIRVFESDATLKREELLTNIKQHLTQELGLKEEQVHVTGMVVLYNNMLQSLFNSQILTIGFVFVAIMLMFAVLFRNTLIAIIAIVPNLLAAAMVMGLMGLAHIPLDMMTITIAAICIGIAVDNSIHYTHRFREEYQVDGDYWAAARRSHNSIGRAMYYTSITITLGFSILAFSNFIPTIYFGLLTGFAMVAALIANMTLLPLLMIKVRPLHQK